jgi:tetratricopeptide (TPR) repeat protein
VVQVTTEVHTPWKLALILGALLVLGAAVGFWWFVTSANTAHEARIAAIDRQAVLGLFDTAFHAGDLERAVTQGIIITELYPTDAIGSVYTATAHIQTAIARFDEQVQVPVAVRVLASVAATTSASVQAEVLRLRGYAYALAGDHEQSLQVFTEAVTKPEALPLVRASRGQALLARGDMAGARTEFEAVLAQDPMQATALLGMAEVVLRTGGSVVEVGSYVDQVFDATSNRLLHARALAVRGAAEYATGEHDRALTTFYDALEYDETSYDAMLGVLMSEVALAVRAALPHQTAIDAMDSVADTVEQLYSGSSQLAVARGLLAALTNQQRDRRDAYDQAIALLPTDRSLAEHDARALREQLTAVLNSTELFVPQFFLSTRVPLEHCVACSK